MASWIIFDLNLKKTSIYQNPFSQIGNNNIAILPNIEQKNIQFWKKRTTIQPVTRNSVKTVNFIWLIRFRFHIRRQVSLYDSKCSSAVLTVCIYSVNGMYYYNLWDDWYWCYGLRAIQINVNHIQTTTPGVTN